MSIKWVKFDISNTVLFNYGFNAITLFTVPNFNKPIMASRNNLINAYYLKMNLNKMFLKINNFILQYQDSNGSN